MPAPDPIQRPLRVAVLIDQWTKPAWVAAVLKDIRESPHADFCLVVRERGARPRARGIRRLLDWGRFALYALYARLDRRWFPVRNDAFARVDVSPILDGVPVMDVVPQRTRYADSFSREDVRAFSAARPDIALRFGFRILRGEVLAVPPFGVWSYHHGDERKYRGGPPGFWEVMGNDPESGVLLQVLSEKLDAGRVLMRGVCATHGRSVHRSRNHVYWVGRPFVRRCLEIVATTGELPSVDTTPVDRPLGPLLRKPGNWRMARYLLPFVPRALVGRAREAWTTEQWMVLSGTTSAPPRTDELPGLEPLVPPPDRYWADPFPCVQNGRRVVFAEEYLLQERRGRIVALEQGSDGTTIEVRPALDLEHHLSYPFLFRWRDELFMVPESGGERRVSLYRCRRFPDEWEHEADLLSGVPAHDATLFDDGERWWMFATVPPEGARNSNDCLCLYSASTPLGPWEAHPGNPVKVDVRSARPAGALFRTAGILVRPAQDCAVRYGHRIRFQKVDRLTATEYRESPVDELGPDALPGFRGVHTFQQIGDWSVLDVLASRRRVQAIGRRGL